MISVTAEIKNPCVWILEDDISAIFVYKKILDTKFNTCYFQKYSEFKQALIEQSTRPDLVIADLHLQDYNFLNFLANGEEKQLLKTPFIIVSSLIDLEALRFCFSEGALDYLIKPFQKEELIAKVEKVLLVFRQNEIDAKLTQKESALFDYFLKNRRHPLSRQELLANVWRDTKVDPNTLDVHLYNLRRKIAHHNLNIISSGQGTWTLTENPPSA